ncbi:MAG: hypothetical protein KF694_14075 [Mesorhizobium sp.]|nr:hypothetical protein [Mesorhizobium sp.]
MDTVRRVTIKTPPTVFVADGPLLSFDLPLIPKSNLRENGIWLIALLLFGGWAVWWVFGAPIGWLSAVLIGEQEFQINRFVPGVLFAGFAMAMLSPTIELGISVAKTVFSHHPVLEIRSEGLIDRRILRRLVRWDEFESIGDRRHLAGSLGMPAEFSFKLKDRSVRRFSPMSALQSFFYGGKRVAIQPYGFDTPPRVILDVILAMIRNAQADKRAA